MSKGVMAGLFYHANSEIDAIVKVGSSVFVHTIAHPDEEESNEDETVNLMQEALAYVTAKCEQKHGEGTKSDCGMCNQSLDVRSTTLLVRQYVGSRCT
jgi:hypothetical protein